MLQPDIGNNYWWAQHRQASMIARGLLPFLIEVMIQGSDAVVKKNLCHCRISYRQMLLPTISLFVQGSYSKHSLYPQKIKLLCCKSTEHLGKKNWGLEDMSIIKDVIWIVFMKSRIWDKINARLIRLASLWLLLRFTAAFRLLLNLCPKQIDR